MADRKTPKSDATGAGPAAGGPPPDQGKPSLRLKGSQTGPSKTQTAKTQTAKTQTVKRPSAPAAPSGSRAVRLLKWGTSFGLFAGIFGVGASVVGLVAMFAGYQHYVVRNPGPQLERSHIRTIISQESPVYYRDGATRVGVFFESEHRLYVPFEEMPRAYVMGIVAAEDGNYWHHSGINLKGLGRAFKDNLLAGGVVSGGSTLTQQTAKNLYYRPDRSFKSKIIELLNALRLEAHFDKTEILEFYVNQFHVTGNGRGLGIAARHFFDKEPDELTVAECAFISGLVKGPTNYDPFLGDQARREKAIGRAHDRTRYVLRRITEEPVENLAGPKPDGTPESEAAYRKRLEDGEKIRAEAKALLEKGFTLPFRRGTFRYESSSILDEVARRLSEPPFDTLLGGVGIDDPKNSGLVVITTLDAEAQHEATYSLWHHLTEVGSWMEGPDASAYIIEGARAPRFDPDFPPKKHEFRVAKVAEHTGAAGKRELKLDLGGHDCMVDRDGVIRVAVAGARGKRGDSSVKLPSADVDKWLEAIPDGSVVLASVRDTPKGAVAKCDLEWRPELQGSVTVLQGGEVRAMVGGNDGRNFNRATALRQFGSTWKPLVYHAALKLGWSPDDVIDNSRNVFPFSTTFYYPKPDHEPAERVSISWAGVNSENLASIWMLYHLIDRLTQDQLEVLAASVDLTQREGESIEDYRARISKLGITPTNERVEEGLFLQARGEVLAGIEGLAHPEDEVSLQSLLYGWGFTAERNRVGGTAWKLRALDNSWRVLQGKLTTCRTQHSILESGLRDGLVPDPSDVKDLTVKLEGEAIHAACGSAPEGYRKPDAAFFSEISGLTVTVEEPVPAPEPEPEPERRGPFGNLFGNRSPEPGPEPDRTLRRALRRGPELDPVEDMLVDQRLHTSTLDAVQASFERRRMARDLEAAVPDLYSPEILLWHQDFRTLLAIRYVASLAEDYGVQTEIKEVLSMPLGASEITLEEATSLYSGLVTGKAFEFNGHLRDGTETKLQTSTSLIQEIRDVDGRVLYRADPELTEIADPLIGEMTADILRNVVLFGTGKRAQKAVPHGGPAVPVGGKTGTTNDFKNAAFIGYVPIATPTGYVIEGGYTVGAYVGYDDNRSMSNKKIKLAGASGALPAWIGTSAGLAESGLLGQFYPNLPFDAEKGWPLYNDPALTRVTVDDKAGLSKTDGTGTILVRGVTASAEIELPHVARPARIAPGTIEALPEEERGRVRDNPIPELGEEDTEDPSAGTDANEELPIAPDGL